ncbi:hypothetical protein F4782DRAFT_525198 [Xylaria castorea]|nr:hypothetical protein F4782DRAFT_525198 [Xylaria castorea]
MAQPPGQRARILNTFFAAEHGFEPENYNIGIILYKRRNAQNVVERIVVKHAQAPGDTGAAYDRNSEISDEEKILRRLWGAEHVIRLLAVVDNRHHRSRKWNEPRSRPFYYLSSILPWKLRVDQAIYPGATQFNFFVMEYLSRGDGDALIHRCQAMGVTEISEPVLWYFFLCLTRACVAMAWPPNHGSRNPPTVVREDIPNPMQRASRIVHGDLHLGNIMFGEYNAVDNIQPTCHQGVPVSWDEETPKDAQRDNIRYVGECIHQFALVSVDNSIYDDDRPTFLVDDIPSLGNFETYLEEDFYRSERLSKPFRQLLAWCMAVEQGRRPSVKRALRICERNVGRTPNWRRFADEISEIYDMVPMDMDTDGDSSGEYEPASSDSDESG